MQARRAKLRKKRMQKQHKGQTRRDDDQTPLMRHLYRFERKIDAQMHKARPPALPRKSAHLSLIHISEPTRPY